VVGAVVLFDVEATLGGAVTATLGGAVTGTLGGVETATLGDVGEGLGGAVGGGVGPLQIVVSCWMARICWSFWAAVVGIGSPSCSRMSAAALSVLSSSVMVGT